MFFTLSVLSLLVVVGTFRLLTLPAVTLTDDPNSAESSAVLSDSPIPASSEEDAAATDSGDAVPAEGGDPIPAEGDDNTPADTGDTTSADDGDTTSADGGDTIPADTGDTTSADDGDTTSAGKEGTELLDENQVPLAEQPAEYNYSDGNGLTVTAVPEDPASIPEGAEFYADRVTQESDPERYAQYEGLLAEESGSPVSLVFNAYDIYFLLDGQRVEPSGGTVSVTITDTTDAAIAPENAAVYHVLNEETDPTLQAVALDNGAGSSAVTSAALAASLNTADSSAEGSETTDTAQSITFTTDSFSAYLVNNSNFTMSSSLTYKLISQESDTYTHQTKYYDSSRPLGIAGNFHIVAFDTATIGPHCSGNILAGTLSTAANFGTDNLADELSYVQNYVTVSNNSASRDNHILVIGSGNKVNTTDGGTHFLINNQKTSAPLNLWQDANTATLPFIDLGQVKSEMVNLSTALSYLSTTDTIADATNETNHTGNHIELKTPSALGIYKISATDSAAWNKLKGMENYFGVTGFTSNSYGAVIIDVDCTGLNSNSKIFLPACDPTIDGKRIKDGGVTSFGNGRILWNFYGMDGNSAKPFSGTISTAGADHFCASILAPNATVISACNMNGTLIGNNVTTQKGETHRDDFVGKLPCSFTASKAWGGVDDAEQAQLNVTVKLLDEDGTDCGTATLNNENDWNHTWSDLVRGKTYHVEETGVYLDGDPNTNLIDQYTRSYTPSGSSCTITNQKITSYELPATGGPGTYLYTIGGLSLIFASSLLLWRRKRRREDCS